MPSVSPAVGVAMEIVSDGETGFIVPANPDVIGERITQLNDDVTRKQIGETLRARVEKGFGWESIIENYIEIYRSLLHS